MSLGENIKERAREAKRSRVHKRAGFIRKLSAFQCLVDTDVRGSVMKEAYEGDFLGEPLRLFLDSQIAYSQASKKGKRDQSKESFKVAKGRLVIGMRAFKRICKVLAKLSKEKSIGFADVRAELEKHRNHSYIDNISIK